MQVQIDGRDNNTVYSGSQFGYYYRVNLKTKEYLGIHPTHELGDSPYRYNWQTPILLSSHNQDILYVGANKLVRSMDKGETFDVISNDLTTGGKKGNVAYGTLTTIAESPFQFGLLYVGSDDGYVNLTTNSGASWKRISDNLPQKLWVSRVIASQHQKERVYVTLNGYRNDDFKPYVFKSDDYGNTWENIVSNLPNSPINVIKEDTKDENILYVGTDTGVFVSFDGGNKWHVFSNGLPKVAVHDLVLQNEAKDLVIGTHGRSIYKAPIAPLQDFNSIKDTPITLFEIPLIKHSSRWGNSWNKWLKPYEPCITISYYVANSGTYTIEILTKNNTKLMSFTSKALTGYNYFEYDLSVNEERVNNYFFKNDISVEQAKNEKYYLPKGAYIVKITGAKKSAEQTLVIE
jgi:archaellum component FlaF (FlaF/FlaG flagellin family)